jgi:hypothetical protein
LFLERPVRQAAARCTEQRDAFDHQRDKKYRTQHAGHPGVATTSVDVDRRNPTGDGHVSFHRLTPPLTVLALIVGDDLR